MSNKTPEEIYLKFKNGEITNKKAVSLLIEEVFRNKHYYRLSNLSEDDFSSFLLWLYHPLSNVLKNYKETQATFVTYFANVLNLQKYSWARDIAKKNAKQKVLDKHHFYDTYEIEEATPIVAEESFKYDNKIDFDSSIAKNVKLNQKQANTLLILAMRSYPNLRNEHIKRIPKLIGIEEEKFIEYLDIIAEKTKKNKVNLEIANNKLNKSYILCNQYKKELEQLAKDTCQYKYIEKKLATQSKLLKMRQEQIKFCCKNIKPKISTIARTLNIRSSNIRKILTEAETNINEIKHILDPEEA